MTVGPDVPGEFLSRDCVRHRPFRDSEKFRNELIREVSEVVNIILERRKAQAVAEDIEIGDGCSDNQNQ